MAKAKNKLMRRFFIVSVLLHIVLVTYLGRAMVLNSYMRRIEIDLADTRPKQHRTIPRPRRRPKQIPPTKKLTRVIKSSRPPMPSYKAKPKTQTKRAYSSHVVERIAVPQRSAASMVGTALTSLAPFTGAIGNLPSRYQLSQGELNELLNYKILIKEKIERCKRYPLWARKQGMEGEVLLRFLLTRSGQVKEVELARSCGNKLLDNAALEAVGKANPYPPFPPAIQETSIWLEVAIGFELHG